MLNQLQAICNKFEELCARSEQPDFYADPQKAAKLLREKNDLEPIVEAFHAYNQAQQDMADAQELMADPEMKELCQETYAAAKAAFLDAQTLTSKWIWAEAISLPYWVERSFSCAISSRISRENAFCAISALRNISSPYSSPSCLR